MRHLWASYGRGHSGCDIHQGGTVKGRLGLNEIVALVLFVSLTVLFIVFVKAMTTEPNDLHIKSVQVVEEMGDVGYMITLSDGSRVYAIGCPLELSARDMQLRCYKNRVLYYPDGSEVGYGED